ncbi:MAG: hypothetical protein FD170_1073 [Bacteroidetes bacterium]|nr:MAG: hypothetical protein FD170_1073 [Bacteroidota bacterium]
MTIRTSPPTDPPPPNLTWQAVIPQRSKEPQRNKMMGRYYYLDHKQAVNVNHKMDKFKEQRMVWILEKLVNFNAFPKPYPAQFHLPI